MRHVSHLIAGAVLALAITAAAPAVADCRDQVRELREEINDGRNGYSPASRIEGTWLRPSSPSCSLSSVAPSCGRPGRQRSRRWTNDCSDSSS
jgi:hypothetical protein